MAKLLCRLFGHRRYSGWCGDGLYGRIRPCGIDGTGRTHFEVIENCDRCGRSYTLARFHGEQVLKHIGGQHGD